MLNRTLDSFVPSQRDQLWMGVERSTLNIGIVKTVRRSVRKHASNEATRGQYGRRSTQQGFSLPTDRCWLIRCE